MAIQIRLDVVKLESVASKLRAMSHPMRIAIIELLNEIEKINVTEIYESLKLEQSAASHHLNILKSKGIVISRRSWKQIYYMLKSTKQIFQ